MCCSKCHSHECYLSPFQRSSVFLHRVSNAVIIRPHLRFHPWRSKTVQWSCGRSACILWSYHYYLSDVLFRRRDQPGRTVSPENSQFRVIFSCHRGFYELLNWTLVRSLADPLNQSNTRIKSIATWTLALSSQPIFVLSFNLSDARVKPIATAFSRASDSVLVFSSSFYRLLVFFFLCYDWLLTYFGFGFVTCYTAVNRSKTKAILVIFQYLLNLSSHFTSIALSVRPGKYGSFSLRINNIDKFL